MRCPVCRAENAVGPYCRRCRVDLSVLWRLREQSERHRQRAWALAADGRWAQAIAWAEHTDACCDGRDGARLRALQHLLQRDFTGAWHWFCQARRPRATS
ncbi:MAG: hypothetical protein NZ700_04570 [Gemmataceae bacterium]|nr:hypothetical protein [Gemmataceae bacterium]